MTKFTMLVRGKPCAVRPDYHTGGRGNGPVAWLREIGGEPTGTALAVDGCTMAAKEHSISWFDGTEPELSGYQIDGKDVDKQQFHKALLAACHLAE